MINPLQTDVISMMAPEPTMMQQFSPYIMIGLMILVLWLFMWRPESKRRKEMELFRAGLKKGDKVISAGGIYGVIKEVKETTIILDIATGVSIQIDKSMVVADKSNTPEQK